MVAQLLESGHPKSTSIGVEHSMGKWSRGKQCYMHQVSSHHCNCSRRNSMRLFRQRRYLQHRTTSPFPTHNPSVLSTTNVLTPKHRTATPPYSLRCSHTTTSNTGGHLSRPSSCNHNHHLTESTSQSAARSQIHTSVVPLHASNEADHPCSRGVRNTNCEPGRPLRGHAARRCSSFFG